MTDKDFPSRSEVYGTFETLSDRLDFMDTILAAGGGSIPVAEAVVTLDSPNPGEATITIAEPTLAVHGAGIDQDGDPQTFARLVVPASDSESSSFWLFVEGVDNTEIQYLPIVASPDDGDEIGYLVVNPVASIEGLVLWQVFPVKGGWFGVPISNGVQPQAGAVFIDNPEDFGGATTVQGALDWLRGQV